MTLPQSISPALLFDVQRFCVHDGPGIRTVAFFKGCPLRCAWCQNPESLTAKPEMAFYADRCAGCLRCAQVCPNDAIQEGPVRIDWSRCDACGRCAEVCPHEALRKIGWQEPTDQVVQRLLRDREFYRATGGGVTLSGGEPLCQPAAAARILAHCHEEGLHTAIETGGAVPWNAFEQVLPHTDLFYFDLKTGNVAWHIELTGMGAESIVKNARRLLATGADVLFRMPVVPGYNDSQASIEPLARLLVDLGRPSIRLLPYHDGGESKLARLRTEQKKLGISPGQAANALEIARRRFLDLGVEVLLDEDGQTIRSRPFRSSCESGPGSTRAGAEDLPGVQPRPQEGPQRVGQQAPFQGSEAGGSEAKLQATATPVEARVEEATTWQTTPGDEAAGAFVRPQPSGQGAETVAEAGVPSGLAQSGEAVDEGSKRKTSPRPPGSAFSSRVWRLRQAVNDSVPAICIQRARLVTQYFRTRRNHKKPMVLQKAEALRHVLRNRSAAIYPDELLVGCFSTHRVGGSVFPELHGVAVMEDLLSFQRRGLNPLKIHKKDALELATRVMPFWLHRFLSLKAFPRIRALRFVAEQLKGERYLINETGGISHFVPDYPRLLALGTTGIAEEARRLSQLTEDEGKKEFYQAVEIACAALEELADGYVTEALRQIEQVGGVQGEVSRRDRERGAGARPQEQKRSGGRETVAKHQVSERSGGWEQGVPRERGPEQSLDRDGEPGDGMAESGDRLNQEAGWIDKDETSGNRKRELEQIVEVCRRIPRFPARTLREAFQTILFAQIALNMESLDNSVSPGRLDQVLFPYYRADLDAGRIDEQAARELVGCYTVKMSEIIPVFSKRITRFHGGLFNGQVVVVGGQDAQGNDATNDLTWFFLDAMDELRMRQPNYHARIHAHSPPAYLERIGGMLRDGSVAPSLMNDDIVVPMLEARGMTLEHARDYSPVGCVEPVSCCRTFGSTDAALTNLALCLEWALGLKKGGAQNGPIEHCTSTDQLVDRLRVQVELLVDRLIEDLAAIERANARYHPTPLTSMLLDGCLESGTDASSGGTLYNASGVQGIGVADVADSLAAIDQVVFKQGRCDLATLIEACRRDYKGFEHIRGYLLSAPKYGNDNPTADRYVDLVLRLFSDTLARHVNTRGGPYLAGFYSVTGHVAFGETTGALPSGRLASQPLASGLSPANGQERLGPTASLSSTAGLHLADCARNGSNVNLKLDPTSLSGSAGIGALAGLVRGYFAKGGMQVQMNILDPATLIEARDHPGKHPWLLVRVSGYSAYFDDLSPATKQEIIDRTLHSA